MRFERSFLLLKNNTAWLSLYETTVRFWALIWKTKLLLRGMLMVKWNKIIAHISQIQVLWPMTERRFSRGRFEASSSAQRSIWGPWYGCCWKKLLAWLKISLYLSLCGAAIMINLRLGGKTSSSSLNVNDLILALDAAGNSSPSQKIQIMESFNSPETGHTHLFTYPLGLIFYILSFISILSSISNYVSTINGYFGRKMTVTSSILTAATITLIATTILASNIFVLWKMY